MVAVGCRVAVVEDGGEVAAISDQPIDIAFAAGDGAPLERDGLQAQRVPLRSSHEFWQVQSCFQFR